MIFQGDIENLPIPDNSIDFIFTDPPYPKKYLQCYEWLANEAVRILKPNSFIMVMCGGLFLNQIFRYFDNSGLDYFFEFQQKSGDDAPTVWKHYKDKNAYPIVARSKPILVYSKGKQARPRVGGVMNFFEATKGWSKQFHHWGQDVASARYYIDNFTKEKDLVFDPFCGGGTTAIACALINRHYICADIDAKTLIVTNERLSNKDTAAMTNLPLFDLEALKK